jgi:hypothetical protein
VRRRSSPAVGIEVAETGRLSRPRCSSKVAAKCAIRFGFWTALAAGEERDDFVGPIGKPKATREVVRRLIARKRDRRLMRLSATNAKDRVATRLPTNTIFHLCLPDRGVLSRAKMTLRTSGFCEARVSARAEFAVEAGR